MRIEELGLSNEDLLAHLEAWPLEEGKEVARSGKHEYDARCPFHDDHGRPNWGINLDTGFYKCLSCGAKGDFVSLYAHMEAVSLWETLLHLRRVGGTPAGMVRRLEGLLRRLERSQQQGLATHPPELMAPTIYPPVNKRPEAMKYLESRGFTKQSIKKFDLRFSRKRNSIVIPVRDGKGVLWGYIYRNIDPDCDPRFRYKYTKKFQRSQVLFGSHLLENNENGYNASNQIVVVEGSLDTIWVNQAGIPAVGILGSFASEHQIQELRQYPRLVLLMDNDNAGRLAAQEVGGVLNHQVPVSVGRYPRYAKDPCEIKENDLSRVVRRAVPYLLLSQKIK